MVEVDFEEVDVVVQEDGDVVDLEVDVVAMAEEEVSEEAVVDPIDSGMCIYLSAYMSMCGEGERLWNEVEKRRESQKEK